jgi:gamma-glutamyltranspeptidase/glutathione hydrolase
MIRNCFITPARVWYCALAILVLCGCPPAATRSVLPVSGVKNAWHYTSIKKTTSRNGAVVSAHPLASAAGIQMLKRGGNAFDAAIATQLALAVVYPNAGNLGGGGFLVARTRNGQNIALDYREMAPDKARRDMYLDAQGNAQTNLSQRGHLASGVPGTVAGLFATLKYAKLSISELIAPAIELAEKGFVLTIAEANGLNSHQDDFITHSTHIPAFIKAGGWKNGDTLLQPDLANTLKRIRDNGAAGFYEGETAKLIAEEMQRGKGIISLDDLKNYAVREREIMSFNYKGYNILTMPPPSSGGVLLPQLMKMVQNYPLAKWGLHSPEAVQLMIEAERRAYADRAEYLGDPDFFKVPVKTLTSAAYCTKRMSDYKPGVAGISKNVKAGIVAESEETTHLSVIDKEGNAVAVTTTLNGGYGSYTVVKGAGFLLNNEMDDFSIKPGVPNMYGAIGGEANAIQPGKRMLSSMTPTIVLKDNKPYLVTGTPGGTTIITSVFQTLINVLEFGLSAEDAVWKPKFHHQWLPDEVFVERDFPQATRAALQQMGYKITQRGAIGRTELIKVWPNGNIEAIADKRGDDAAEGY